MAEPDKMLGAGLRLLQSATTDEECVAGLMLVVRAPDRAAHAPAIWALCARFVRRMLRTPQSLLQRLAVGVLAFVSGDASVAADPALLARVPRVVGVLRTGGTLDGEAKDGHELQARANALECLRNVAGHAAGLEALVAAPGMVLALMALLEPSDAAPAANAADAPLAADLAQASAGLLVQVAAAHPDLARTAIGPELCDVLTQPQAHVFAAARALHCLLAAGSVPVEPDWSARVAQGLQQCLSSKLGPSERDLCLQLAAAVAEVAGPEWLALRPALFGLVTHLACVELRMQLEDRPVEHMVSQQELVTACLLLAETAVRVLTTNEAMGGEAFLRAHEALQGGVGAAMAAVETLTFEQPDQQPLLQGCVRLVAVWMSEETDALHTQISQCMPRLLAVAAQSPLCLRFLLPGLEHHSSEPLAATPLLAAHLPLRLTEALVSPATDWDAAAQHTALRVVRNLLLQLPPEAAAWAELGPAMAQLAAWPVDTSDALAAASAAVVATYVLMAPLPEAGVAAAAAPRVHALLQTGLMPPMPAWWPSVDDLWAQFAELLLAQPVQALTLLRLADVPLPSPAPTWPADSLEHHLLRFLLQR